MKKYLCLLVVGTMLVLAGCEDSSNRLDPRYQMEQKKKMEESLNQSLERNINRNRSEEDL